MELCGISLIFSRLFAKLFQVPRPLPKAATVGTDQTKTIQDRADINDANLAAPAQPSTMDDDFDIDIPLDDLETKMLLINSVFFKNLFEIPRPAAGENHLAGNPTTPNEVTSHTETGAGPHDTGPGATQASNQAAIMDEELDIEAFTPDLNLFAKFLTFAVQFRSFVQATSLQISLEQAGILLPLADRYECFDLRTILRQRVAFLAQTKPWEVLVLASKQNDVDMGRTAISNLTERLVPDANEEDSDRSVMGNIAKLDGPWQ
jgi:hypothetical protein